MTINGNTVAGKWTEIKGEIQKAWGKLTADDLEQTKGDMTAISGLIQQKYGEKQDIYGKKLADIFSSFEIKVDEATAKVKDGIRNV